MQIEEKSIQKTKNWGTIDILFLFNFLKISILFFLQ